MKTLKEQRYNSYVKIIIMRIDHFSSKIIDERNFGLDEEGRINVFTDKYSRNDDIVIVRLYM